MDSTITHNHYQLKKNVPELKSGDRVRVHQKIREGNKERIQIFEGIILKMQHGRGINGTFTVRRIASGVGVEKTFPLHMPAILKIEKIKSAKVRRAKLYYVRSLVGKAANRLKGEKEDLKVWEDVIVKQDQVENLEDQLEDVEEATENAEEEVIEEVPAEAVAEKNEVSEKETEAEVKEEEKPAKNDKEPSGQSK